MRVPGAWELAWVMAAVVGPALPGCHHAEAQGSHRARGLSARADDPARVLARAGALRDALDQGALPGGVDRAVQDLTDVATHDPYGPHRVEAQQLAGDLLARRAHLGGHPDDVIRADALYRAAAIDPAAPGACDALHARVALWHGDTARTRDAQVAWVTACVPEASRAAALQAVSAPAAGSGPGGPGVRARTVLPAPTVPIARVHRVVLDPGHGGTDPGAIGPTGLTEASVNLDVARRVAERLATRHGVQVVLTRDADVYVPLEDRAAHANTARAELFVSIHCNSAPNVEARGISTYILDTQSDRVAARVQAREGELVVDDPVGSPDLPRILAGLRLARQGSRSTALADQLQSAMLHDARLFYPDAVDAGVHPAAFHVLVTARMPAALVELSFISNAAEETRLRADGYRDVLASGIARAIAGFDPDTHAH